jgi:TRAP-type C4-dicarboxylate transport system permease small subunit
MKVLDALARLCAVLAGLLLTGITLMTCASLVGRNTTGWTITGDFEISGFAAGAAIALFMPLCQARRGNIIVDFFTARASMATQHRLDRFGAALLALAMALMTWRTTLGGISAFKSQAGSMMVGVPEWWVYLAMVPALALTAVIAAVQATFTTAVTTASATTAKRPA